MSSAHPDIAAALAFGRSRDRYRDALAPLLASRGVTLINNIEFGREADRTPLWRLTVVDHNNVAHCIDVRVTPPTDPFSEECAGQVARAVFGRLFGDGVAGDRAEVLQQCISAMVHARSVLESLFRYPSSIEVVRELTATIAAAQQTRDAEAKPKT